MAGTCHYHPDKKGTASCPQCRMSICDACRLRGTSERCMTCQAEVSKGGSDATRAKRTMCTNHESTPTDTNCKQCRKPHCVACLNGASLCFRCAMAGPRQQTGQLKARGTGPLKPEKKGVPPKMLGGGIAAVMLVALLGYGLTHRKGGGGDDAEPFMGKSDVKIVAPAAGGALKGSQVIKLKVASHEAVEKVELTIDGKYWEKWTAPEKGSLESDWPTGVFKNGPHEVVATVKYRGGRRMAADKKKFTTKNR